MRLHVQLTLSAAATPHGPSVGSRFTPHRQARADQLLRPLLTHAARKLGRLLLSEAELRGAPVVTFCLDVQDVPPEFH